MTKITDIYEGGSHQMQHCDDCELPCALTAAETYSGIKHLIIEAREAKRESIERLNDLREVYELEGNLAAFDATLKCLSCAEGLMLLINGEPTGWQVGGNQSV